MPTFAYKARNASGGAEQGTQEAPAARDLADSLRQRGLMVVDIHPIADGRRTPSLLSWLQTIADQTAHPGLRQVLRRLAHRIQAGAALADAMADHRCFPPLAVALVRVGETSGTLDDVLAHAAATMERTRLLRNDLLSALLYPAVVLLATVGVTIFMGFVTLPRIETLLQALGRRMPPMTQLLLDVSWLLRVYLPGTLTAMLLAGAALVLFWLWPPGRLRLGRLALRVPLIGHVLRLSATALLARVLGAMLQSGLNLVEALRAVEALYTNPHFVDRLGTARSAVLSGGSLAGSLDTRTAFLPMLGSMIGVGESSGTLDEVLAEVARFSEQQLQRRIQLLSALVGPVTILVVGAIVGFVYMSFFLAMFAATGG